MGPQTLVEPLIHSCGTAPDLHRTFPTDTAKLQGDRPSHGKHLLPGLILQTTRIRPEIVARIGSGRRKLKIAENYGSLQPWQTGGWASVPAYLVNGCLRVDPLSCRSRFAPSVAPLAQGTSCSSV